MTESRQTRRHEHDHLPPVDGRAAQIAQPVEGQSQALPASRVHAGDFDRPARVQRQRAAGWRMPIGAVYVGRPTRWGNPFPVASRGELFPREDSVRMYRELVTCGETTFGDAGNVHRFVRSSRGPLAVPTVQDVRKHLAGLVLACFCPLDVPCHADVLLELANDPGHFFTERSVP